MLQCLLALHAIRRFLPDPKQQSFHVPAAEISQSGDAQNAENSVESIDVPNADLPVLSLDKKTAKGFCIYTSVNRIITLLSLSVLVVF